MSGGPVDLVLSCVDNFEARMARSKINRIMSPYNKCFLVLLAGNIRGKTASSG